MYSLELSLRYSPFPISIQKKEFDDVKRIYDEIKSSMNETIESSSLIELKCDKVQDKLIAVRACLLYTSPSPRDISGSRMPSSA